jgi:hypothetical protein
MLKGVKWQSKSHEGQTETKSTTTMLAQRQEHKHEDNMMASAELTIQVSCAQKL